MAYKRDKNTLTRENVIMQSSVCKPDNRVMNLLIANPYSYRALKEKGIVTVQTLGTSYDFLEGNKRDFGESKNICHNCLLLMKE